MAVKGDLVMSFNPEQGIELDLKATKVFTPSSPVNKANIFAGRLNIYRKVIDTILSPGQHAILYGERGVGKTSLANVIAERLGTKDSKTILAPRINCDGSDSYSAIWKKVFNQIYLQKEIMPLGFVIDAKKENFSVGDSFENKEITPDDVKNTLTRLGRDIFLIVVIDEFDRLQGKKNNDLFADTIKTLSDYNVPATLLIVGVADNVNDLISGHQSVERAIVQIQMPRMSINELREIINNGMKELLIGDNGETLQMVMDDAVIRRITILSQGLPHYTHSLALTAIRKAIDDRSLNITIKHLNEAMNDAIDNAHQTIKEAYQKAVTSPRKNHLYEEVLLACALAKTDDLSYFYAADVKEPMTRIMHKLYSINAFARHLNDFCDEKRGPVLKKSGLKRHYQYRFISPLMQPYVILQGVKNKMLEEKDLESI